MRYTPFDVTIRTPAGEVALIRVHSVGFNRSSVDCLDRNSSWRQQVRTLHTEVHLTGDLLWSLPTRTYLPTIKRAYCLADLLPKPEPEEYEDDEGEFG